MIDSPPTLLHLKEILVPTDFSDASKKALHYAQTFADQFGAVITLLHVIEPPPAPPGMGFIPDADDFDERLSSVKQKLSALAEYPRAAGTPAVKSDVRVGRPSHDIVEVAKELDTDLIVLATHGHTGWKHLCLGSTAERVVRCAPCPVFVVREKEHEFI